MRACCCCQVVDVHLTDAVAVMHTHRACSDPGYCSLTTNYSCTIQVAVLCNEGPAGVTDNSSTACNYAVTKSHTGGTVRLIPGVAQVAPAFANEYLYFTLPAQSFATRFTVTAVSSTSVDAFLTNSYVCMRVHRCASVNHTPCVRSVS